MDILSMEFKLEIGPDLTGRSVKKIMYEHFKMSTRLINKVKWGCIFVNDTSVTVNKTVNNGDILKIILPPEESENIVPTAMTLSIIYEDEYLLVIDKPPYIPVHPSQGNYYDTLANGVVHYWQQKGQQHVYRPVNRLDKDTSGLIIIAKNQYAHQQLSQQIIDKRLQRKYLAVVHGIIPNDSGFIEQPIARKEGSTIERVVSEEGQYAATNYTVISRINDFTLVELILKTGRTHQIRVHMSHLGCPLVGDWLYGKRENNLIARQALHAYCLAFLHPISGEPLEFKSEMPEDIKKLIHN